MRWCTTAAWWGLLALTLLDVAAASAAVVRVQPGAQHLLEAIRAAAPGDRLTLEAGIHHGPIDIDRSIRIVGEPGSVVDGGGVGRVVTISAPDVTLRGTTIVNSGTSLATEDSGIFVTPDGDRALIVDNDLRRNLIGIYLKGPSDAVVRDNRIEGRRDLRMNERGNGIHLWNTPGSRVQSNRVRFGRDGIFVTTSRNNLFQGNHLSELRFAVHYMYTNLSEVSENVSRGNHIGFALMYSTGLQVRNNRSEGDRDRGILLNYANSSEVRGNIVRGGVEKCVFIYNANMNRVYDNYFEGCAIGVHFTAGSERNEISGNAFLDNRTQVKYVGTRHVEWSENGRGNYWSDNLGFDLNGDGIADRPYQPNGLVDQIVWRHPLAKLLLSSPAMHVLRWAQSQFPALHPGGVTDSAPLMEVPAIEALLQQGTGGGND